MCHRRSGRHNLRRCCDVEDMRPQWVPVSGSNSISLLEPALSLTSLASALTQMHLPTPPHKTTTTATTTSNHRNQHRPMHLFYSPFLLHISFPFIYVLSAAQITQHWKAAQLVCGKHPLSRYLPPEINVHDSTSCESDCFCNFFLTYT